MSEPTSTLPIALLTCPASLTLLVLAGLTRQLPATSLDDAWDALPDPGSYRPTLEVENWLREHWSRLIRPDTPDDTSQNFAPQVRAREKDCPGTVTLMSQTPHPHAHAREPDPTHPTERNNRNTPTRAREGDLKNR